VLKLNLLKTIHNFISASSRRCRPRRSALCHSERSGGALSCWKAHTS